VVVRTPGKDGACPALKDRALPAGTYFFRIHHLEPSPQFDYRMVLSLAEPE
jgi:hypothetical protein